MLHYSENQDANNYPVTGLIPGTTYYWRIDEVNTSDPNSPWKGDVWSFKAIPLTAWNPSPPDGIKYEPNQLTLRWSAGSGATSGHAVYFGETFDDVNNAPVGSTTSPPYRATVPMSSDPNWPTPVLQNDKTYYWRIDEIKSWPGTVYKGAVWSFTTTRPGGGLKGSYYNGANFEELVLERIDPQINFDVHIDPLPPEITWPFSVRWTGEVEIPFSGTWDFITNTDDGVRLWVDDQLLIDRWTPNAHPAERGTIVLAAGKYALQMELFADDGSGTAQLFWEGPKTPKQLVPQGALSLPVKATIPNPLNGATGVPRQLTLTWEPGKYADKVAGHELYFSSNFNDVNERTATKIVRNVPSYTLPTPPAPLNLGQTYYWAVDEVNDPCLWEGDVWSFTVANYIVVEDFNSYAGTTAPPALRTVWKEGSPIATVWLNTDSNYVRDGNSMQYDYDNYYDPFYSEAYANTAALPSGIGSNWKVGGVKALALWFYGKAGNDANRQMYVKLTDSASKSAKIIYDGDGDADDVREAQWHEWNIALQEFVDACSVLNLANVSRITIGFGDGIDPSPAPNPAGTVYFDDIRLYIPRCMPGTVPDSASGNCLIDYPDLLILTNNWLISEYDVVPVEPNNNNLIGWWKLDEGAGTIAADSSIYDNDGNLAGDPNSHPQWVAGHIGSGALDFNGVHDYVDCSNDVNLNEPNITGKITLAAWVKTNDCGNGQINPYIAKGDHAYTLQHYYGGNSSNVNVLEFAIHDAGAWYFAHFPVDSSFNNSWHHLAGTYNGSQIKLYVDGELKTTTDYVGSIASDTNNVNLGKSSDFTDRWYNGLLDDVRIYSRALSQEEVAYLAERSTFTQPLEPLLTPHNPGINLYKDGTIDLRDYAVLASKWLEEVLWPAVP